MDAVSVLLNRAHQLGRPIQRFADCGQNIRHFLNVEQLRTGFAIAKRDDRLVLSQKLRDDR